MSYDTGSVTLLPEDSDRLCNLMGKAKHLLSMSCHTEGYAVYSWEDQRIYGVGSTISVALSDAEYFFLNRRLESLDHKAEIGDALERVRR